MNHVTEAGQILDAQASRTNQAPPSASAAGGNATPAAATIAPKEVDVSSKLAVLMERERQAVNREKMARAQEEKLKDRITKVDKYESAKTDPKAFWEVVKDLGWDYDKITQSQLQDGQVPPSVEIQQLRSELAEMREQQKQDKDLEVEEQKKRVGDAETRAVTEFKSEITEYLKSNEARYELISFEEADGLVFEIIDEHYSRTIDPDTGVGKVMSIAEAADKVEKHLEEKYIKAKEKSKVKAFWGAIPKPIQQQLEKQKTSQPPKTLTNNLSARVSEKTTRPPEDKRIAAIVEEHVNKMRSQYAG